MGFVSYLDILCNPSKLNTTAIFNGSIQSAPGKSSPIQVQIEQFRLRVLYYCVVSLYEKTEIKPPMSLLLPCTK
jgi:hypothetical protein